MACAYFRRSARLHTGTLGAARRRAIIKTFYGCDPGIICALASNASAMSLYAVRVARQHSEVIWAQRWSGTFVPE